MGNLFDKVVLVTGGAQGIGKGIVKRLLTDGACVVIADIDAEAGSECLTELSGSEKVRFFKTDVANEESVRSCIDNTLAAFQHLDALINNAGILPLPGKSLETTSLEEWNRTIQTNLTGVFLMAKYGSPHLKKTHGSMVNIASTRALQSEPNTEAYSASKGGVVALTHALSMTLGPDIRVNCISPGWIETSDWKKKENRSTPSLTETDHRQHPCGRVGKPDDIAAMVSYLISAEAEFITGQNFVIDGGMTRKMIYAE